MKKETINQLYKAFEQYALEVNGVECWSARDLQKLLGYSLWQNFTNVINKAKEACKNVGQSITDHFIDVNKMIVAGKGAQRDVDGFLLTRYDLFISKCASKQAAGFMNPSLRNYNPTDMVFINPDFFEPNYAMIRKLFVFLRSDIIN